MFHYYFIQICALDLGVGIEFSVFFCVLWIQSCSINAYTQLVFISVN